MFIEVKEWYLTSIPILMKDIVVEVPELGYVNIDSAWIEPLDIFEESNIGTHFLP